MADHISSVTTATHDAVRSQTSVKSLSSTIALQGSELLAMWRAFLAAASLISPQSSFSNEVVQSLIYDVRGLWDQT